MAQFASMPTMQSNPFSSYFEQFSKAPYQAFQGFQGFQGAPMEAFIEMNGITTRLCSELARQHLKMLNQLVQCGVEELQSLSQAQGLPEVLKVLSQGAAKASPPVFEHAQSVLETLLSSANEYSRLIEEGIAKTSKATSKFTDKMSERKQA